MKKCAFFPTIDQTLPIIRYINNSNTDHRIVSLLSYPGSGLIGYDGSRADLRSSVGIVHEDIDIFEPGDWESLLVADYHLIDSSKVDERLSQLILRTLQRGKNVVCAKPITASEVEEFQQIADIYESEFKYLPEEARIQNPKARGSLEKLNSFYVGFGSMINDFGALEAFLRCADMLSRKLRVSLLCTDNSGKLCGAECFHYIFQANCSEVEKVYEMNRIAKEIEYEEKPDVVLYYISSPLLPFDDAIPNDFGIIPFLVSKALPSHMFYGIVPYEYANRWFVEEFVHGIEGQFGYETDGIIASNTLIDATTLVGSESISTVYVDSEAMAKSLNRYKSDNDCIIYDVTSESDIQIISDDIFSSYKQKQSHRTIP